MSSEKSLTDKQLEILHEHYKETFARLREAETLRDRLFLWLIGLFALLILEIGYPIAVGGTLGKFSIVGGEFNLQALPLPALLNATWVLTLTIGLRYCQISVLVNRQYPYLHTLEAAISPAVGGGDLYQREGQVYLREYPVLLNVAWFAYGFLFPLIVIFAALALVTWEIYWVAYPFYHTVFDAFVAGTLVCFFFLYRIQPAIVSGLRKWRMRSLNKKTLPQKSPSSNSKSIKN